MRHWNSQDPVVSVKRSADDTDAIVPTGPSNLPMGDGAINVKRSDGNPEDTDDILPSDWWNTNSQEGDGVVTLGV